MRRFALVLTLAAAASAAQAGEIEPREGWVVMPTEKSYDELVSAVKEATKAEEMGVVTEAGPTEAAAGRGVTIPGNRVIGVFRNDYAVDILNLSTAAMIEAPIRIYVTENEDGTAMISYKTPSAVFAPYAAEGGAELMQKAAELDGIFAAIATKAAE